MPLPTLSRRLATLLAAVRAGEPLWDLGCDHGLLGLFAVAEDRASEVVLVDRSAAVIAALREKVEAHVADALRPRVSVRLADAARLPAEPVSGTVVIAGMGADRIVRILDAFVAPNARAPLRLALQPEVRGDRVADWLERSRFSLLRRETVEERARTYDVFVAELGGD